MMRVSNPIIPGFHPDPSVCRVGDDYFLVTSSFEYFPGVPLFHSRDLVHWRQIGHVLSRVSQLPLAGVKSSCGIFAPTLRFHDGRFYMTTTNTTCGGNFFVWSDDPFGEWSDPLWVDQAGIDPSLLFDDDGLVYFTSEGPGGAYQSRLDIRSGSLLEGPRKIWSGTGGRNPEAPHLYRRDGLYYLLLAEGGTEYGHMVTCARSKSPWGPFVACPHNPILSHRDSADSPIQATGHADLVEAADGSWWAVFLGVRPTDTYPPRHHIGRETFLAPVTWTDDGWPEIGRCGRAEPELDGPRWPAQPWPAPPVRDRFEDAVLAPRWEFRGNPAPACFGLDGRGLTLNGTSATLDSPSGVAWVGRRQTAFDCRAATVLEFDPCETGEAGLSVLMCDRHHTEIFVRRGPEGREIAVRRRIGDLVSVVAVEPVLPGPVTLFVTADKHHFVLGYQPFAGEPVPLCRALTKYFSTEVAGGFTGVFFGLYATGNGRAACSPATFSWFEYETLEKPAAQ